MLLVGQHLVVRVIAGGRIAFAQLAIAFFRNKDVGIDGHQPQARLRLNEIGGIRQAGAQRVARLLVGTARPFLADFIAAPGQTGLAGRLFVIVIGLFLVAAVGGFPVEVFRLRHHAVTPHELEDFLVTTMHDFGRTDGAIAQCPGLVIAGAGRDAVLAENWLLLAADTEIILLSGSDGVRPLRIVVAQRDKEIQSFFLAVALHHLLQAAQVNRLAVVAEVAGNHHGFQAARHGIVKCGDKGKVVFVEQPGRGQLRTHGANRRVFAIG